MSNSNPPETNPITVTVPNRASNSGTTPLNQPVNVSRPVNAPLPLSPTPITPVRRK